MIKKIKGTKDYYGNDSLKFQFLIKTLEKISYEYDLEKFITPTFEETQLFSRTVGNESDVVNKEMYTFFDRKNRSISLKPEGTASIVRSIIENKLVYNNEKRNYYYITQMFRYERPQKGRQREFYQFGVERFGEDNSYFDVETILIAKRILDKLSISQYELHINTIGSFEDRNKYNKVLNKFINKKIQILSKYAQEKFHSGNVFRIFDSKDEQDLKILKKAPLIYDFISNESKKRFVELKKILDKLQIKYYVNERLVRGLDYYNDVVFEFISTDEENLGSKSTIIGGGRYNHLINKLDNNIDVPAIGFALGIERLLLASNEFLKLKIEKELDYYIFVIYDEIEMKLKALTISEKLREKGFSVKVNYTNEKISKKYSLAEKEKALNVIVIGKEIYDNEITIKNLKNQKIERKKWRKYYKMNTNRIIGKHALILTGRGKTEIASQIFVYDHIREVRVDIEKLEVKVLMNYDEAYFRVYKVEITKELNKEAAVKMVLDFYSKLLNASMKFSKEELENLEKNRKQIIEKTKKNGKQ